MNAPKKGIWLLKLFMAEDSCIFAIKESFLFHYMIKTVLAHFFFA